jgi:hypothetical protein
MLRALCTLGLLANSHAATSAKVVFAPYPGYNTTGGLTYGGTAVLSDATSATQQDIVITLSGADPLCNGTATKCGAHIHTGTSCGDAAAVGGHYYGTSTDVWNGANLHYTAASDGAVKSYSIKLDTNLTMAQVIGRVMVVHSSTGTRVACGPIVKVADPKASTSEASTSGAGVAAVSSLGLISALVVSSAVSL